MVVNLGYPWCALGGFNAICNAKEKSGGRSCDHTIRNLEFSSFIINNGLHQVQPTNPTFTWSND